MTHHLSFNLKGSLRTPQDTPDMVFKPQVLAAFTSGNARYGATETNKNQQKDLCCIHSPGVKYKTLFTVELA